MTQAQLSGPSNPLGSNPLGALLKWVLAVGAALLGVFVFAVGATFVLFALVAVAVVGALLVAFFWARARLTGRPFGPREHLEAALRQMQAEMPQAYAQAQTQPRGTDLDDGPVLDARQTPSGWSVDG